MTDWFARPVLHVTDVEVSLRFYVDRLGFTSPWRYEEEGRAQVISVMDEADVKLAVCSPIVTFGSDSEEHAEDGPRSQSKVHPRSFGTFARVLGFYVREQHCMTLEEAVRKITSLAASRVGLMDRGILRPGMFADVTIFDPNSLKDVATFQNPMHYSVGVKYVFVNGRPVIWDGDITQERSGRPLRGPAYQSSLR